MKLTTESGPTLMVADVGDGTGTAELPSDLIVTEGHSKMITITLSRDAMDRLYGLCGDGRPRESVYNVMSVADDDGADTTTLHLIEITHLRRRHVRLDIRADVRRKWRSVFAAAAIAARPVWIGEDAAPEPNPPPAAEGGYAMSPEVRAALLAWAEENREAIEAERRRQQALSDLLARATGDMVVKMEAERRVEDLEGVLRSLRHGAGLLDTPRVRWCWCVKGPRVADHDRICQRARLAMACEPKRTCRDRRTIAIYTGGDGQLIVRYWRGYVMQQEPLGTYATVDEARAAMPKGWRNIGREQGDDPALVECWQSNSAET